MVEDIKPEGGCSGCVFGSSKNRWKNLRASTNMIEVILSER